jgi:hypothetical protein
MIPAADTVEAQLFDGRHAQGQRVSLRLFGDELQAAAQGDLLPGAQSLRRWPLRDVEWPERTRHPRRTIHLADGCSLQVDDGAAFDAWAATHGRRESWVVRAQQSWQRTLWALLALVLVGAAGYQWGLPWAAERAAYATPAAVESLIGERTLAFLDERLFEPSEVPPEKRQALTQAFARALSQAGEPMVPPPEWRLEFRKGSEALGPNALALRPARCSSACRPASTCPAAAGVELPGRVDQDAALPGAERGALGAVGRCGGGDGAGGGPQRAASSCAATSTWPLRRGAGRPGAAGRQRRRARPLRRAAAAPRLGPLRVASAFDPQTMDPHAWRCCTTRAWCSRSTTRWSAATRSFKLEPALALSWQMTSADRWRFGCARRALPRRQPLHRRRRGVLDRARAGRALAARLPAQGRDGGAQGRRADVEIQLEAPDAVLPEKLQYIG